MKLKRPLHGSETGADVRMVQRALNKASRATTPSRPTIIQANGTYDATTQRRMRAFRAARSLNPGRGLDQESLDALWPYFDAYGRLRYRTFKPVTKEDIAFERLLAAMEAMDASSRGYILGAGHGVPLRELRPDGYFDCSSSCSFALWQAGLFDGERAIVSGLFATSWGKPGEGRYFTVYANAEHVWIRLKKSRWYRFDTSPHVDGRPSENPRRGPRLRYFPRFTSSFTPRHWEGM